MPLQGAIAAINQLKKQKIISDYAIYGGYAVAYYLHSAVIKDLDIIVPADSQDDFRKLFEYLMQQGYLVIHFAPPRKGVKIENIQLIGQKVASRLGRKFIDDILVQFFPGYGGDLNEEAIRNARQIKIDGLPARVVSIEYLIATLLKAFRLKDKKRISELVLKADVKVINDILSRHDNEKDGLHIKLEKLLYTLDVKGPHKV